MWNTALSLIVMTLALALLSFVMTFRRHNHYLFICMISFLFIAAAFGISLFQPSLNPWIGIVAANTLLLLAHLFFPWSIRIFAGHPRAWPRRFWLYVFAGIMMLIVFKFYRESYILRAVGVSLFILLCTIEYIRIILFGAINIHMRTRYAVALLVSSATIFHGIRIILLLMGENSVPVFMQINPAASVTLFGTIFYLLLWSGGMFLIDNAYLLSRMDEANRRLEALATHDPLTGLLNRHSLDQSIRTESERQDRYHTPLSGVMIDVDYFKRINDTFGHDAGDRILVEIARRIDSSIRENDILFRWGGEEFLVLAPNTGVLGAGALAEKIRKVVSAKPIEPTGTVTVSCGIAERNKNEAASLWFKKVDKALYLAKGNGRNRVELWDEESRPAFTMVQLSWNTEWDSGNISIDNEHRELLRKGNQLLNMSIDGTPVETIRSHLGELVIHIRNHFSNEEEILGTISYPDLANHHQIHAALIHEAEVLYENYRDNTVNPSLLFHLLVDRIVTDHLVSVDRDYFEYLKNHSPS